MSVYVDNAVFPWRGRRWAHLLADSLEELHRMARALGLPPAAFQNKRSGAHYDVDAAMRVRAIELGAQPLSRHHQRERYKAVIARARLQALGAP